MYLSHKFVHGLGANDLFPTAIVEEVGRDSGPDECHNTLGNHGAVEHRPGQTLALQATRHQGALRSMETADGTTGYRDEQAREPGILLQITSHTQGVLTVHDLRARPLCHVTHVPQLGQVRHLHKQSHEQSCSHHQQCNGKQRIDPADDFVDGQQCGNHIVGKNGYNPPDGSVITSPHILEDERWAIDEHSTHHHQQEHSEHQHHYARTVTQVLADERRQVGSIMTKRQHTTHEVVHRSGKDAAQHNPQVGRRAEPHAHDGTENRARSRNVQELNHEHLPCGQRHKVHTVGEANSGGLAVIGTHHALHDGTVNEVAHHKGNKADNK